MNPEQVFMVKEGRMTRRLSLFVLAVFFWIAGPPRFAAAADVYTFGVNPQRSVVVTAQYWNPILQYVSRTSGVRLELKLEKTGQEYSAAVGRGDYDLIYTNHFFSPANARVGYRVFARPVEDTIRGAIVTLEGSPIRKLEELNGLEVGFPSKAAFVGYAVTQDALMRKGVTVKPVFGGTQEGIMTQLKIGKVVAAGVNSQIMRDFARREQVKYRTLWQSPEYFNLPLAFHPRVPAAVIDAVRKALVEMADTPEGQRILQTSAALIGQKPPLGFTSADDGEYRNQWDFYRTTVVPELRK